MTVLKRGWGVTPKGRCDKGSVCVLPVTFTLALLHISEKHIHTHTNKHTRKQAGNNETEEVGTNEFM